MPSTVRPRSLDAAAAVTRSQAEITAALRQPRGKPMQVALPVITAANEQPGWQGAPESAASSSANKSAPIAKPVQKLPSSCVWDDRLFTLDKDTQGTVFSFLDDRTLAAVPVTCRAASRCLSTHLGEEHFMRERIQRSSPAYSIRRGNDAPSVGEQYMSLYRTPYNRRAGICTLTTLQGANNSSVINRPIDERTLLVAYRAIQLFDMRTGRCIKVLKKAGPEKVSVMIQAPNGRWITGDSKGFIKIRNPETGACEQLLRSDNRSEIRSLLLIGENTLISSGYSATRIWNLATGTCEQILPGSTDALLMTKEGHVIISDAADNILILDPSTGKVLHTLTGHEHTMTSLLVMENRLISTSYRKMNVWDIPSGTLIRTLVLDGNIVSLHQISNSEIAASLHNSIAILNIDSGQQTYTLKEPETEYDKLQITPEKTFIFLRTSHPTSDYSVCEVDPRNHILTSIFKTNYSCELLGISPTGKVITKENSMTMRDFSCSPMEQLENIIQAFQKADPEAIKLFEKLPKCMKGLIAKQGYSPTADAQTNIAAIRKYIELAYPKTPAASSSKASSSSGAAKVAPKASDDDEKQESPRVLLQALRSAVYADDETIINNTLNRLEALDRNIRSSLHKHLHDIHKDRGFIKTDDPKYGRKVFTSNADAKNLCIYEALCHYYGAGTWAEVVNQTRLEAIDRTLGSLRK